MVEWTKFRTSPLFRLTQTYEEDLNRLGDPQLEEQLAEQLRHRLAESSQRRDANLRGLLVIDGLLAIALSGQNFTIPVIGFNTGTLPALLEILVGLASYAVFITAHSFTTWLCYQGLLATLIRRAARDLNFNGGVALDADHFNEMGLRLLQNNLVLGGEELLKPLWGFRTFTLTHDVLFKVLFALIPIMHISLVSYGIVSIFERSGLSLLHSLLYVAVASGHLLAVIIWVAPTWQFNFLLRQDTTAPSEEVV